MLSGQCHAQKCPRLTWLLAAVQVAVSVCVFYGETFSFVAFLMPLEMPCAATVVCTTVVAGEAASARSVSVCLVWPLAVREA